MGSDSSGAPLYRTKGILKQLAARIVEVVLVEKMAVLAGIGDFHRARVKLSAESPLVRVVTHSPEGKASIIMQVKYEKLPLYCAHCGRMGHIHTECGEGEYSEEELQFGQWMIAHEKTWRPSTPRVCNYAPVDGGHWNRDGAGARGGRTT